MLSINISIYFQYLSIVSCITGNDDLTEPQANSAGKSDGIHELDGTRVEAAGPQGEDSVMKNIEGDETKRSGSSEHMNTTPNRNNTSTSSKFNIVWYVFICLIVTCITATGSELLSCQMVL